MASPGGPAPALDEKERERLAKRAEEEAISKTLEEVKEELTVVNTELQTATGIFLEQEVIFW